MITQAGHRHLFPCNPPGGTFSSPGACECGLTYARSVAERMLAEALAAMTATEPADAAEKPRARLACETFWASIGAGSGNPGDTAWEWANSQGARAAWEATAQAVAGPLEAENAKLRARLDAADTITRDIFESLCRRDGLSLESSAAPGEPARNYELADRLGVGSVFGLQPQTDPDCTVCAQVGGPHGVPQPPVGPGQAAWLKSVELWGPGHSATWDGLSENERRQWHLIASAGIGGSEYVRGLEAIAMPAAAANRTITEGEV